MLRVLAAMAAAASLSACEKTDDAAFGARVREYLLTHPEVIREAVEKLNEKEQLASAKAKIESIAKNRVAIERDSRDLVINPAGKITVTEFYDYRCGYCKRAAAEVVKLAKENPDLRFVFKELPIFGEVSDTAARIALTPAAKARGLELYSALMEDKALSEAGIDKHLADLGVDAAAARKAAQDPEIVKHLAETKTLAHSLGIEGTPAFVVGDILVPGADMNALHAAITVARAGDIKKR